MDQQKPKPRFSDRLVWGWVALVTALCVMVSEVVYRLGTPASRKERYWRLVRVWARLLVLGHSVRIEGVSLIPKDQGVLFASNHQSNMDIPLLHAVLPVTFRWLARHDLFTIPVLGRAMRRMDAIEVDRANRNKAVAAFRATLDALSSGANILVFPEGTWGDSEGRMREFKPGVYSLARKSGVPVVPLTIIGSNRVNPPKTPYVHRGSLRVVVHAPISPEECARLDAAAWLQRLREDIGAPLGQGAATNQPGPDASVTERK